MIYFVEFSTNEAVSWWSVRQIVQFFQIYICSWKNEKTKKLHHLKLDVSRGGRGVEKIENLAKLSSKWSTFVVFPNFLDIAYIWKKLINFLEISSNQAVSWWSVWLIVQFFPDISSGINEKTKKTGSSEWKKCRILRNGAPDYQNLFKSSCFVTVSSRNSSVFTKHMLWKKRKNEKTGSSENLYFKKGGVEKSSIWLNRAPNDPLFSLFRYFLDIYLGKSAKFSRNLFKLSCFVMVCSINCSVSFIYALE